jgi:hypothetical protein
MVTRITIWERYHPEIDLKTKVDLGGYWSHNHISNGWEFGYTPEPKAASQKNAWASGLWRSKFGFLHNHKVILPKVS